MSTTPSLRITGHDRKLPDDGAVDNHNGAEAQVAAGTAAVPWREPSMFAPWAGHGASGGNAKREEDAETVALVEGEGEAVPLGESEADAVNEANCERDVDGEGVGAGSDWQQAGYISEAEQGESLALPSLASAQFSLPPELFGSP